MPRFPSTSEGRWATFEVVGALHGRAFPNHLAYYRSRLPVWRWLNQFASIQLSSHLSIRRDRIVIDILVVPQKSIHITSPSIGGPFKPGTGI